MSPSYQTHTNIPSERGLKASLHSVLHYLDAPIHATTRDASTASQQHDINIVPKFNVVETSKAYFLEGEFPGVKDKNHIMLEKIGPKTLKVNAEISVADPKAEWGNAYDDEAAQPMAAEEGNAVATSKDDTVPSKPAAEAGDDATEAAANPNKAGSRARRAEQESGPRHWISERHQGHFQRSFTFPIAVDFNRVKARLADGLLRIMAPKSTEQEAVVQRIPVEG